MKFVTLITLFVSSSAFAASFPTGTFDCKTSYKDSTVVVTAVQLGGIEVPAVVFSGDRQTFTTTGIGATSKGNYGTTASTITLATGLHNTVFDFDSASKLIAINGSSCR